MSFPFARKLWRRRGPGAAGGGTMKLWRFALFVVAFGVAGTGAMPPLAPERALSATIRVGYPGSAAEIDLQSVIDLAQSGDTLLLPPGVFRAHPKAFVDSLCGNCEGHREPVAATTGFAIRGKALAIVGSGVETVLETNAGYGVYFEDSRNSSLCNLAVTGGARDPDGRATDAAVVARRSRLIVSGCTIAGNGARVDSVVVGIGGVFGREGAELFVIGNTIRDNGWDGIALYRGATAYIADNTIEKGRGAGIGITWDAHAIVLRNRISEYWKGIGTFGASTAVVRENAVFDNLGWGIIATGTSHLDASNNVVRHNGNCGLAVWSATCTGRFTNNVSAENGWRKEWVCPCVGVYMESPNERFEISYNDVWGNEAGGYSGLDDLSGRDGNLAVDPGFADGGAFALPEGSPLIDAGNPLITDADGSRSDIGLPGASGAR